MTFGWAGAILALSVFMLLYTLALYPAFLIAVGSLYPRVLRKGGSTPGVALIVAACNEERYIGRMLEQALAADYPREQLEILVAADAGSTDRTHEIVRAFEPQGVRLCLPAPGLIGKNVCLDEAVRTTRGEILLFADATAIWSSGAIRSLVANFDDPRVGCISARKTYWLEEGFGPGSYKAYWSWEGRIDRGSTVFGYIPNASGGMHALRRSIYQSVPNHMIRDLVDPAQAVGAGYDSVLDPDVAYVDAPWVGADEVYRARVRITNRALSSAGYILGQLLKGRRPFAAVQYVSHKLLRWFLWLPVLGLLVSSLILAPEHPVVALLAGGQVALYLAAALNALLPERRRIGALTHLGFFLLSLMGMAHGFLRWLGGGKKATWRLHQPETSLAPKG
jgi:cellulose synthase/poly-beta-1,6-N-acetylglucosamine synthase-like glycosyltransferase